MTDEKIVELFWARSESALTETANKYQNYCLAIARNILHSPLDADECVNDTWLRTWNTIPDARPTRLSVFVGKITRNLAIDRYKRRRAAKRGGGEIEAALSELDECIPDGTNVEQTVEGRLLAEAVDTFLGQLSTRERTLFVGRYWYACPISQIAADLAMSESNVKTTLFRIRSKLKKFFKEEGFFYER